MRRIQTEEWQAFVRDPVDARFEALYAASRALVYTICLRKLRDPDDALDAFQSTYSRLVAVALDPTEADSIEDPDLLIRRLAVREADNLRKRRARRGRKEVAMDSLPITPSDRPGPGELCAEGETRVKIETLVETLPEKYRLPLLLHYFHGWSHEDIAATLSVPRSTITHRINKAIRRLKPLLHRAGLADALTVLTAAGITSALFDPPQALGAATVFSEAKAAIAAGGVTAAGLASIAGDGGVIAGGATTFKTAILGTVGALTLAGLIFVGVTQFNGNLLSTTDRGQQPRANVSEATRALQGGENIGLNTSAGDAGFESPESATTRLAEASIGGTVGIPAAAPLRKLLVKVLWRGNEQPVAGAEVKPQLHAGATARPSVKPLLTDQNGMATLVLTDGPTMPQLEVHHPDAINWQSYFVGDWPEILTVRLVRGAVLSGRVWNAAKKETIADAKVHLLESRSGPIDAILQSTETEKDGSFRFAQLAAGTYGLTARAGNLRLHYWPAIDLRAGQASEGYNLQLVPGAALAGVIRDQVTGAPIPGAQVVFRSRRNVRLNAGRANERGEYRLEGLFPGEEGSMNAVAKGYAWGSVEATTALDQEMTPDVGLTPGYAADIRVIDSANGKPIPGVEVGNQITQLLDQKTVTDPAGRARLLGFPTAAHVRARHTDYEDTDQDASGAGLAELTIAMRPRAVGMGYFTGRVTDVEGRPLEGISVQWGGDPVFPDSPNDHTETLSNGTYRLQAEHAAQLPVLFAHGRGWVTSKRQNVKPGTADASAVVDFRLQAGHWLAGLVVDEQGQSLADEYIRVGVPGTPAGEERPGWPFIKHAQTDSAGRFRFESLPGPELIISFERRGITKRFKADQEVVVSLGNAAPHKLGGRLVIAGDLAAMGRGLQSVKLIMAESSREELGGGETLGLHVEAETTVADGRFATFGYFLGEYFLELTYLDPTGTRSFRLDDPIPIDTLDGDLDLGELRIDGSLIADNR